MTKKSELRGGTMIPPRLITVANDKGGQGKSLVSLAVADHAHLHEAGLGVAQVDTQLRLARALGRKVLTIEPVARDARRDPSADARAFTPFYSLLEKASGRCASVLLDVGANQVERFVTWAGLVDLEEDLVAWSVGTTILVPFVAEGEGIRQAGHTVGLLVERFPAAQVVLVENERDGCFSRLHPASDAANAYRSAIEPVKARAVTLRMPAIEAGSWRAFEAAGCRLVDVPQMSVEKVMSLTGLPRPVAKIARGDVAAWAAIFFAELDRVLPWRTAGGAQ
jgi:hypothetical protein